MSDLPIPLEALEDCGAILGKRGSGKSGTGCVLLEHELDAGHRCCVLDPKGDWWGIRMMPDGTPSPYEVAIFGGQHGDIELTEHMGTELGKTVATNNLSCIVDISEFSSEAAMRRFTLAFTQALYRHNRAPLTLFVDEADQLAPQRVPAEMAKLLNAMEKLIRLGRQRGIFMWMLTQRPQVLNKNLLSQAETLIAMKMTTPHDRKAIQDWMNAHDPEEAKRVIGEMAKLSVGEAFAWVPAVDYLQRVQFPLFSTYDSRRTPKHGEDIQSLQLPTVELPEVLKALAAQTADGAPTSTSGGNTETEALLRQANDRAAQSDAAALTARRRAELAEKAISDVRAAIDSYLSMVDHVGAAPPGTTSPPMMEQTGNGFERLAEASEGAIYSSARVALTLPHPLGAERKALAALVQVYPAGMTDAQWAVAAGYKRSGGTWANYKSKLRKAELIEQNGQIFTATPAGTQACGGVDPLPPRGPERVRWWAQKLKSVGPMAEALISYYPGWVSRERLAHDISMTATGGSFQNYLSKLSTAGLIERDRELGVRLTDEVMR